MDIARLSAALALVLGSLGTVTAAAPPREFMVELLLKGERIEGLPLAWDEHNVHLLARDGRLWEFSPDDAREPRQTAAAFQPYSPSELRAELLREMGRGFDVTGTTHYMIAHAAQQRDKWAQRFEELHRAFVQYFSVRGFALEKPRFPLLGIVCRDQAEFMRYSAARGLPTSSGILGWYETDSNRIILYDFGGKDDSDRWKENAAVIIHEATHQSAFNTGVHSRYAKPPLWVAEGLATMFEAPGVYDAHTFRERGDRINRARFSDFCTGIRPRHKPELLRSIVASDQFFQANPGAAYAEAWALTFFLVESEPQKYCRYLKLTASRPPFSDYTPQQRTADFVAVYGADWTMFEARFLRFIDGLSP